MEIKYAFVAEAATSGQDGRVNALGIFQAIHALQFPAVFATLFLVVVFEIKPSDFGANRDFSIRLITADGGLVSEQRLTMTIPNPTAAELGLKRYFNMLVRFQGITFEKPGTYEFAIEVNTRPVASVPFQILLAVPPKPA